MELCASNFIETVWTGPFSILTWQCLCLLHKDNLWCDFKCRPWAKNSSPNTNDLYIHYTDKSTGTPPSLEEKKALPNCGNRDGNIILKKFISTSVATVLKCMKWLYTICKVIGVWWLIFGSRSAFKVTPEVFSCFLQTSQVLPHWLNHHFSLILALYTEALSC